MDQTRPVPVRAEKKICLKLSIDNLFRIQSSKPLVQASATGPPCPLASTDDLSHWSKPHLDAYSRSESSAVMWRRVGAFRNEAATPSAITGRCRITIAPKASSMGGLTCQAWKIQTDVLQINERMTRHAGCPGLLEKGRRKRKTKETKKTR